MSRVLGARELNRALLARQGLLARSSAPACEMVERLVGMQAQVPGNPYVALWSRLLSFDPLELSELVAGRGAVRAQLMRSTIHLVTARDMLAISPVTLPVLARTFKAPWAAKLAGASLAEVVAAGCSLLAEAPRTRAELAELLAPRWPDADPAALAHAVTFNSALVQVPPRGLWGGRGQATWALAEDWLAAAPTPTAAAPEPAPARDAAPAEPPPVRRAPAAEPPLTRASFAAEPPPARAAARAGPAPAIDALVLRYLAAFGPATVADIRTWSGLTGLRPVVERLRPHLRTFRDEQGRELLDVLDGPLPDPDTPAPPRLLPEYDNVFLSHADRARVLCGLGPGLPLPQGGRAFGSVLADGFFRAFWQIVEQPGRATLTIDRFERQPGERRDLLDAIAAEAEGLLALLSPDAEHAVRFDPRA